MHERALYLHSGGNALFIAKYRHQVLDGSTWSRMEQIMWDVRADLGAELAEFDGADGHVHLLVNFLPTVAICRLVNSRQGGASAACRNSSPACALAISGLSGWSGSYFAGSARRLAHHSSCAPRIKRQNRPSCPDWSKLRPPTPTARRPTH